MAQTLISRGFGALQRVIARGFFSAAPPSPDCFLGFNGEITDKQGFQGLIEGGVTAVVGIINSEDTAVIGTVYPQAAFNGIIDESDLAVNGAITDKEGFQGVICEC